MKDKLDKLMIRAFAKPLYRIALVLLGLPTFVVAFLAYMSRKGQEDAGHQAIVETARKEAEEDGSLNRIRENAGMYLTNKYHHFNKDTDSAEFKKELEQQIRKDEEAEIAERTNQIYQRDGLKKRPTFIEFLCGCLNNQGLLVLSVITSLPMYVLLLISANPYSRYIFERLIMMIFVAFGVVFVVFTILHFASSDPAVNVLGETATAQQIADFNRVYGLDQPYIIQLLQNFKNLATFNLGNSYSGNEDVMAAILRKFPVTLEMSVYAFLIAVVISIPIGILTAVKPNTAFDYVFMFIALVGLSLPAFWFGMLLILTFSINNHILPASYVEGNKLSLLMPAIVSGTHLAASLARNTRSALLEVLGQDYIVTAKAKGLSNVRVIAKHALGNALIPIVTVAGLQFGGSLGGSAVIEKVFNVKGIGSYVVDKQFLPDIPAILGGVVYVSIIISLVNLAVDLIYVYLDPRIKSRLKSPRRKKL
ncbi:MAG: ABC transporter permease [Clostridiales bacterium]|nr:ABC transporter permease [Clostridiales bacterium]